MTPEEASKRYHWCKYIPDTNTVELYLDNYMLSCARQCEAKFYLEHLLWVKPRYDTTRRKSWFLDFGEYIHWCVEEFYNSYKINGHPPAVADWMDQCKMMWAVMKMDDYGTPEMEKNQPSDYKKYVEVKGWEGVSGLLIQYYAFYMDLRNRIIDTEITFGHNKEVCIGRFRLFPEIHNVYDKPIYPWDIRCYLTGRIDLLVDNGYKIGPVDHKTTHKFDGWEHLDFNPHDGMTGYILAINEILKQYQGMYNIKYPCTGGWIYHISACTPSTPRDKNKKPEPRFKTTPIDKTDIALSDYKARQLSTFKRIAELLFNDKTPEWNTITCNNVFFRPCEYKQIHEQPSNEWEGMIKQFYQITTPWDTREHGQKKEAS